MKTLATICPMLGCILLAGCGKQRGPELELVPVSGVVTLDGQPLRDATVAYYFDGAAPQGYFGSGARTDDQGRYELRASARTGAVPGSYKVTVSRLVSRDGYPVQERAGLDSHQLLLQGMAVESLAPRYSDQQQTELRASVEKGRGGSLNFDLRSG